MDAALPPNEMLRLENLRSYAILDTPPEQVFDDLTVLAWLLRDRVARRHESRQWFKSKIGIDVEVP